MFNNIIKFNKCDFMKKKKKFESFFVALKNYNW